jgi:hypothetical protein
MRLGRQTLPGARDFREREIIPIVSQSILSSNLEIKTDDSYAVASINILAAKYLPMIGIWENG